MVNCKENSQQQYCAVQQQLRCTLQQSPPPHVLQELVSHHNPEQIQRIGELLSRALRLGESNSALIVGPRGVGKSAVLQVALSQFCDSPEVGGSSLCLPGSSTAAGVLVRLHGLIQTDDRLALREITRQLRLEETASLKQFGSFAENLSFLLTSLHEGTKSSSKCVVFVLDEFDLFCHHRNQTLLYNLFDVAQSAQSPICVLGLTCRLDAVELLEKRVRSRFSHRQVHLQPPPLQEYSDLARRLLSLTQQGDLSASTVDEWNSGIDEMLEDDEAVEVLEELHSVSRDIATLKQVLRLAVSDVTADSLCLTSAALRGAVDTVLCDVTPNLLQGLSTLHVSLLIAMMHLTLVYEGSGFTFELVHSEYLKFTRRRCSVQSFEKPVVFKAFDQLRSLELVTPYDGCGARGIVQKEYQSMKLQLPPLLLRESLAKMANLPTDLLQWAKSDLA